MGGPPIIRTERLLLRPFRMEDAPRVQELAGAREIYATTEHVPHPYEDGMAEQWIASLDARLESREQIAFAITLLDGGALAGSISLRVAAPHRRAALGYWIGVPYWGRGYATEAAVAVIRYGFEELGLHKITAQHMTGNPASARVMVKAGMQREGELVDEFLKDGVFHSVAVYGIVNSTGVSE
ncbi:MAG TPA: GNAT family N-acetyltransferase [Woeseiaceae bacterium]|nr:GNAT family N-acetyltransferase [Woeseiaceae bacterium]